MAKAKAPAADGEDPRKGSVLPSIIGFVLVTMIAGASGVFLAWQLQSGKIHSPHEAAGAHGEHGNKAKSGSPLPPGTELKQLPSILTNLAGDKSSWIRLDLSVMLPPDTPQPDVMTAQLAQDILAFLRTVTPAQIEGPMSFQLLQEDLQDIARTRSQGKVQGLLIRSFVIE